MHASSHAAPVYARRDWLKGAAVAALARSTGWGASAPAPGAARVLTAAHRRALRDVLEQAVARKAIPGGALVVLSRGAVVLREAVGRTEFDGGEPYSADAPCAIASVTKPVAATFFALLDERGLVRLDDPVVKYLPQFRGVRVQGKGEARETLRVWHLLSHRSGLPGNSDMGDDRPQRRARQAGAAAAEQGIATSFDEAIAGWLRDGLLAEPGARFAYGSSGYMVAARIAEIVMGGRFDLLLEEHLLRPLGMSRTSFHPADAVLRALPARYASTAKGVERDTREMPRTPPGGLINPAGGLISCPDDLAAFLALHLRRGESGGRRLLAATSLARLYQPHPPRATETADGGGIGYGLGWNVIAPGGAARHLGASGTLVWLDLRREHAGALVTQVKWGPANRPLIQRLMREVQAVFADTTDL